jgi:hypothetical protein
MNTPESKGPTNADSPLVEPDQSQNTAAQPTDIDTDSILRLTESLPGDDTTLESQSETGSETGSESGDQPVPSPQGFNVLAIVSLILALVASPLTIIFGYIAVGQARRANQRGEGIAWVAIGLGWAWLIAWVVLSITLGTIWLEL